MEIIEIGAVMVNGRSLKTVGEFQSFVRPVRHPVLTSFCDNLTGISADDVEAAPTLAAVLLRWSGWACAYEGSLFCSWGDYDRRQLEQDCRYHGLENPFEGPHLNLKAAFSQRLGSRRPFGLKAALARAGLTLVGRHHRGLDDARNSARLLPFILRGTSG